MNVSAITSSPAVVAAEREALTLKKARDVEKAVAQSLVELVKAAPAPGRIDTYA